MKSPAVAGRGPALLRDVALKIESAGPGSTVLKFDGSARGDVFDRLTLNGTIDLGTGAITLAGELSGLNLSESLRRRIPREARPYVKALALNSGMVDLELNRFHYTPAAPAGTGCIIRRWPGFGRASGSVQSCRSRSTTSRQ